VLLGGPQPVDLLVEVADLSRAHAESVSQKRADGFEFSQCFVFRVNVTAGVPMGFLR
jgi:hypothetical protein